jgi:hypothetical protein
MTQIEIGAIFLRTEAFRFDPVGSEMVVVEKHGDRYVAISESMHVFEGLTQEAIEAVFAFKQIGVQKDKIKNWRGMSKNEFESMLAANPISDTSKLSLLQILSIPLQAEAHAITHSKKIRIEADQFAICYPDQDETFNEFKRSLTADLRRRESMRTSKGELWQLKTILKNTDKFRTANYLRKIKDLDKLPISQRQILCGAMGGVSWKEMQILRKWALKDD